MACGWDKSKWVCIKRCDAMMKKNNTGSGYGDRTQNKNIALREENNRVIPRAKPTWNTLPSTPGGGVPQHCTSPLLPLQFSWCHTSAGCYTLLHDGARPWSDKADECPSAYKDSIGTNHFASYITFFKSQTVQKAVAWIVLIQSYNRVLGVEKWSHMTWINIGKQKHKIPI